MNIFTENEAEYFCQNFDSSAGNASESIKDHTRSRLRNSIVLSEGTAGFDALRSHMLRNIERCLFLAASNYSSTHKLLASGSVSWAHVTSYYCAFYSATALLGMFGAYVDPRWTLIDSLVGTPGSQKLRVSRNQSAKNRYSSLASGQNGPHQIFWNAYYWASRSLHAYVTDPKLRLALMPNGANNIWQIENRNEINYDTFKAIELINDYARNFNPDTFPAGLLGVLNTQFIISEAIIMLAYKYAKQFNLRTDALHLLPGRNSLSFKIKRLIFKTGKGVAVSSSAKSMLC